MERGGYKEGMGGGDGRGVGDKGEGGDKGGGDGRGVRDKGEDRE